MQSLFSSWIVKVIIEGNQSGFTPEMTMRERERERERERGPSVI